MAFGLAPQQSSLMAHQCWCTQGSTGRTLPTRCRTLPSPRTSPLSGSSRDRSRASSGTKLSTVGLCHHLDADMGDVEGQASPVVVRSSPIRSPSSMARKSGRIRDSGMRVADKAARHAATRDLPASGTPPAPSPLVHSISSPTRLDLPSYSDEHLSKVLADSGISLDHNFGSPSSLIALIRANEVAQAAIAKAKEIAAAPPAPPVVAEGGSEGGDPASSAAPRVSVKKGAPKRAKSYLAPCRSSLLSKTFLSNESLILECEGIRR
mgnify:CR=1 FL=1